MCGGVWYVAALLMTITSLPWWMAKDAGHFERNGPDVDLFYQGASSVIVQAMLAGEANFGGLAGPAIVTNVIGGGDVIQIAAVVKTLTVPMFSAHLRHTLDASGVSHDPQFIATVVIDF